MSSLDKLMAEVRRANASQSTGPKTAPGKQRSSMNALKHNLSGQNLILQDTEVEAYNRMATAMLNDLNPKTEPERQIAQKIIDNNFRLNRLTAIENNMFNFSVTDNEKNTPHDDRIEVMVAQTRAWLDHANSFDILGRYETRLSRQLLKYQQEFERLQTARKEQGTSEPASFGKILSHLPAPTCTAGDLVAGSSATISFRCPTPPQQSQSAICASSTKAKPQSTVLP